jgi:6-pyruvoyltetrahydropterin/6-carboxytetrahydropterin synthase
VTASVTRKYRFSASHRLHTDSLSESENARVFGKCNNPYGHGHDYELEVTLRGVVDPLTGLVAPIAELDRHVATKVLSRFANKNINRDVSDFQSLVPTTENLILVILRLLRAGWPFEKAPRGARLVRVHLQETGRNGFELILDKPEPTLSVSDADKALAPA